MGVGLVAVAFGFVLASVPAVANDTYVASSYPYSTDAMIGAYEEFDSHEITAVAGEKITFSARATTGGCIIVIFGLGHNFDFNTSLYLPRYSQETCVSSFSEAYTVPPGGGPDFSIVITSEIIQDVDYHLDINASTPNPVIGILSGIAVLAVFGAIIGGISYAIRRRKRAPPPIPQYSGYAQGPAPGQAPYPPTQPPAPPMEPPQTPPPTG